MPKRVRILPYKQGSKSAKALADALGGRVLKLEGSGFTPRSNDVVINWGKSSGSGHAALSKTVLNQYVANVFNCPEESAAASNKLIFFNNMPEDIVPAWWANQTDIPDDAFPVVCRTILNGHSGAGIVIANSREELVHAQLYVKYVKKQDEYRIHVGRIGELVKVISTQRKARRLSHDNPNWQVRNLANGFVFVRSELNPPEAVTSSAIAGLHASGLDFGAVDVIWNNHEQRAYVLEINTAPGLEGQTITDYVNYFQGVI